MQKPFCTANNISFSYPTSTEPVIRRATFALAEGWTGIVGANGAGKSTLARLLLGAVTPDLGTITAPSSRIAAGQSTERSPDELLELLADPGERAYRIIDAFAVEYDWPYRWDTLSHGERRRGQLAGVLYLAPEMLVLDEPTNHLDSSAVEALARALRLYSGIGVIISHDRSLLDALCNRTLFIDNGTVTLRPGGVSSGISEAERERESAVNARRSLEKELSRIDRQRTALRGIAASADSRRSKRGLARKDHDARARRDLARLTGKDAVGGKMLRQTDAKRELVERELNSIQVTGIRKNGVTIGGDPVAGDFLFRCGPAQIPLGESRSLSIPELEMEADARIVITGPNGSGKSTLVRHILAHLDPVPVTSLPQEIPRRDAEQLLDRLRKCAERDRGAVLSTVSRLGSDPSRLLASTTPSPGEARKLLLAFGIAERSPLIVMDEPTNHMDLPSILALTEALRAYGGGMLFVTHDRRLADELARTEWRIVEDPESPGCQRLLLE